MAVGVVTDESGFVDVEHSSKAAEIKSGHDLVRSEGTFEKSLRDRASKKLLETSAVYPSARKVASELQKAYNLR